MALPGPDTLKTLDIAFQAEPFVQVASKTSLESGDYAFQAEPFTVAQSGAPVPESDQSLFFMFF